MPLEEPKLKVMDGKVWALMELEEPGDWPKKLSTNERIMEVSWKHMGTSSKRFSKKWLVFAVRMCVMG